MTGFAQVQKEKSFTKKEWSLNDPFEHKVFIENKGQFDNVNLIDCVSSEKKINFGVSINGEQIYFTRKGFIIQLNEIPKHNEEEREEFEKSLSSNLANKVELKKTELHAPHFIFMQWLGANKNPQIITELPVNYNFIYSDLSDDKGLKSIIAKAFEKIIYKDIYPGIDIEFSFPKDKAGLKYAFIVHPGANPNLIKIKYTGDISCFEKEGNIVIKTSLGDIIDHSPLSFYQSNDKSIINSSFSFNEQIISFKLDRYNVDQTVIIDPWLTIPSFPGYNAAYDMEYDLAGNAYIYGGHGGANPFQEIKINNVGNIQWVYTTNLFGLTSNDIYAYGDFVVNKNTGTSYIAEAIKSSINPAPRVIKLNSSGIQTGLFSGNPDLNEMWRISYNYCTNKVIIAGGNYYIASSTNDQGGILDTNMTSLVPLNILSTTESTHDFSLLALDNSNNCFLATAQSTNYPSFNNFLIKCSGSTLSPPIYAVPNGHSFYEINITYVNNGNSTFANGFNGMAVNNNYVYTYDGNTIKKWNKNSGTLINSVSVGAPSFISGGIAVDECDNIFVGVQSSIKRYDGSFSLISTTPTTNTVYDVKLDPNNLLYACGYGFASSFLISNLNCNTSNPLSGTINSIAPCDSLGSATVTVNGGTPPYTYLWCPSAGGQTTQTATGLASGNYTVTVTDASCTPYTISSSVNILLSVHSSPTINGTDTVCSGIGTTITANGGGTYNWNTGALTPSVVVNPLTTTLYSVIVSNGSCHDTASINIVALPNPIANAGQDATINIGAFLQLNATGGGVYNWSPSYGLSCTDCQGPIATPSLSTSYTVIVTDTNGCKSSSSITIEINCGEIFVPSAFSPNNDGQNDLECTYGNCIEEMNFAIFDRWGEKVFETNNKLDCWDGTFKGQALNSAVFVYCFNATLNNGTKIFKKGNISLNR